MHIWTLDHWEKYYNVADKNHRTGIRIRFENGVHSEVRRAVKAFLAWLRREYFFPIRVPIYIKATYRIKARDGDMVFGTCFSPFDHRQEPFIRIAAGDYEKTIKKIGKDDTLAGILRSIAHELTHYFQWINDIQLTEIGMERQASQYAGYILDEYAETREHP